MADSLALELKGITKTFGSTVANKDVDLQVRNGEILSILGENGSGKTNLLEAVHYCALGRSHRTGLDREVVRKGAMMAASGVTLRKRSGKTEIAVKLTPSEARKKTVFIDCKRAERISALMGHVQCVIFSPEDLMLVKEGPAIRRRMLDMMLSQLSTAYFSALQQYQKALEQRTALLREAKRGITPDPVLLDTFEEAMATPCGIIMPLRDKLVKQLAKIAAEKYERISGRPNEMFRMTYQPCVPETSNPVPAIQAELKKSRQEDIRVGGAGCGIHREDIGLSLMGRSMKVFASQGQIRTAALAIKLAQLETFRAETGETPILLLDDVMSELDMTRRTRLLREIEGVQTFITCTDESDLDGCREKRSYRVWMDSDGEGHVQEESAGDEVTKSDIVHDPELDEPSGK